MDKSSTKLFISPNAKSIKIGNQIFKNSPINIFEVYAFDTNDRTDKVYELIFKIVASGEEKWHFGNKTARDLAHDRIIKRFSIPFQSL